MERVMRTFDDTKAWNLPVVDAENKYLGFVSKSKIFNSYREVLVHFSEDWGLFGIYYFTIYKLLFAVRGDGAL